MAPKKLLYALAAFLVASTANATDWDVRARGRLVYRSGSGLVGVPGARVCVMNNNGHWAQTLGEGWTDANGYFSVSGRGGDMETWNCDHNCSKPDVFVNVHLRNDRVQIATGLGVTWYAESPEYTDTAGDIDFGIISFSSTYGNNAAALFATEMQQYNRFQRLMGGALIPGVKMNVAYPSVVTAGVPWTDIYTTFWPAAYTNWKAVFHEFGHRLRHAADGNMGHFVSDVAAYNYVRNHSPNLQSNLGFAFNEGWAEYHAALLDDVEWPYLRSRTPTAGGDETEGNVASKLFHLSETCGGFPNMWATLTSRQIHSYAEFEAAMRARFPNYFRVPPPPPVPPRVVPMPTQFVVSLAEQTASLAGMHSVAPVKHAQAKFEPVKTLKPEQVPLAAEFNRLLDLHKQGFNRSLDAAHTAYKKHSLALKPIGPENMKGGAYLQQRQGVGAAFLKEALTPQLDEVGKLMGEYQQARGKEKNKELYPYLDEQIKRCAQRQGQLRQALAAKSSPVTAFASDYLVELLPRGFGESTAQAR